jgi:hypothetical protein
LSRLRPRARSLRCASVLVVATLGLAACGSQARTLRTANVALAIAATIHRQFGIATAVRCPSDPPERSGYRFACTARLAVGTYRVAVLETDSRGTVSYTGTGQLRALDSASIERAIKTAMRRKRRAVVSVRCPSPVLQQSGLAFTCTAQTGTGTIVRFTVKEDDGNGRITIVNA